MTADERTYAQRAVMPDRVWVGKHAIGGLLVYSKMPDHRQATEYMRVMMRHEVEKFAQSLDGVDPMQLINSLQRTIEGQRKHIARLQKPEGERAEAVAEWLRGKGFTVIPEAGDEY